MTETTLPPINALLNGLAALLLLTGFILVKRDRNRHWLSHAWFMGSAFAMSTVFLSCYLVQHYLYPNRSIGLPPGVMRTAYFVILLIPHIVLAAVMVPMILATLYFAWKRQWDRHRRLAVPTFWIWLYVSVTGVVIYLALYHWFPRASQA